MRLLDLFSGIGGFSLAAKWVWGENLDIVGFCEIDDYCEKVLNKNFPMVKVHKDIKELNGKKIKEIDIITGGFPCQDISCAGNGEGIEGERSGLWSEMFRIIGEIRPRFVIIENVPMLTIRGGVRVISDLAKIGYDSEWQTISAKSVGAWHKRDRIWIIAYSNSDRLQGWNIKNQEPSNKGKSKESNLEKLDCTKQWRQENLFSESLFCRKINGLSYGVDRLKGLGNAIVPQVAEVIMKRIKKLM